MCVWPVCHHVGAPQVAGVLLLAYKYFDDGVGEAIIVNANLGEAQGYLGCTLPCAGRR